MSQTRRMEWTCPKCRTRNGLPIPEEASDGKRIAVVCDACGAACETTVVVRSRPGGRGSSVYGVAWV